MAQFNIYRSSDPGAPNLIGVAGALITLLDQCLVNGYGTGSNFKSGSGWTKPLPNSASVLGCWKQGSGSMCTLFVNDNAPNTTLTTGSGGGLEKDAWATGYESIIDLTSSAVGNGIGQFPFNGQQIAGANTNGPPSGSLIWRKSNYTVAASISPWIMFADERTFYLFVQAFDTDWVTYYFYGFGDIYSYKQTYDQYKCMIVGRSGIHAINSQRYDNGDSVMLPGEQGWKSSFIARQAGGMGRSVEIIKNGNTGFFQASNRIAQNPDGSVGYGTSTQGSYSLLDDYSVLITPVLVVEPGTGQLIRGEWRGMYMLSIYAHTVSDGQILDGANELIGRRFYVVKQGPSGGMWLIEISNTLNTN